MKPCPTYSVWFRDDAGCAAAIRSGGAFEVEASSYGANDVVLEFLVTSASGERTESRAPASTTLGSVRKSTRAALRAPAGRMQGAATG
jgi:hypothetical protein